ncbi:hypothetical protein, partial [Aeromonas finlandensis]|uniref:hypothetical protein n=1 Tax=Aeromonas finlandensis TaxID=1543375 RepID=UPI0019D3AE7E
EGLFAMDGFSPSAHRFVRKNEHISPASRSGFGVFSVLNSQYLAFICRKRTKKPVISTIS